MPRLEMQPCSRAARRSLPLFTPAGGHRAAAQALPAAGSDRDRHAEAGGWLCRRALRPGRVQQASGRAVAAAHGRAFRADIRPADRSFESKRKHDSIRDEACIGGWIRADRSSWRWAPPCKSMARRLGRLGSRLVRDSPEPGARRSSMELRRLLYWRTGGSV